MRALLSSEGFKERGELVKMKKLLLLVLSANYEDGDDGMAICVVILCTRIAG